MNAKATETPAMQVNGNEIRVEHLPNQPKQTAGHNGNVDAARISLQRRNFPPRFKPPVQYAAPCCSRSTTTDVAFSHVKNSPSSTTGLNNALARVASCEWRISLTQKPTRTHQRTSHMRRYAAYERSSGVGYIRGGSSRPTPASTWLPASRRSAPLAPSLLAKLSVFCAPVMITCFGVAMLVTQYVNQKRFVIVQQAQTVDVLTLGIFLLTTGLVLLLISLWAVSSYVNYCGRIRGLAVDEDSDDEDHNTNFVL